MGAGEDSPEASSRAIIGGSGVGGVSGTMDVGESWAGAVPGARSRGGEAEAERGAPGGGAACFWDADANAILRRDLAFLLLELGGIPPDARREGEDAVRRRLAACARERVTGAGMRGSRRPGGVASPRDRAGCAPARTNFQTVRHMISRVLSVIHRSLFEPSTRAENQLLAACDRFC